LQDNQGVEYADPDWQYRDRIQVDLTKMIGIRDAEIREALEHGGECRHITSAGTADAED
jgi:hypothetical protein